MRFDPALLEIEGVTSPASVLDASLLDMETVSPGVLRISGDAVIPARGVPYTEDVLFALQIRVHDRQSLADMRIELDFPAASQNCEIITTTEAASGVIHACPASVTVGFDTTIIAIPGRVVEVPILLRSRIDFRQTLQYDLRVEYDEAIFTYTGFSIDDAISRNLTVSVSPSTGSLRIRSEEGMPLDTSAVLITLRFRTDATKSAQPVAFRLSDAFLVQKGIGIRATECVPWIVLEGERLYVDGICQPLLRRKEGPLLTQNSPNPVTMGSGTTIPFTVTGNAPVLLEIVDEFGRNCAVLVDGILPRGRHTAFWNPALLPSGVYLCILRDGDNVRTRKVLVTR